MQVTMGITQWCWPGFSIKAMPEIRKAGFGTLQPEVGSWEDGLPLSGKEYRKAYAEAAAEAGLRLLPVSVNTVCQHPFTEGLDTPDGLIALKALDAGIEAAAEMKAEGITVPNFGRNKILEPAHRENTVRALRHACEAGLACGVNVYTENLLSPSGMEQLFADCPYPNLYLLFDSQNYVHNHLNYTVDVLRACFGRIGSHVHVKAGTKTQSAPLSCGDGPVEEVLAFLKEKKYTGSVVLENNYMDPPLFSSDLRFMLEDIRFVYSCMADA